MEKLLIDYLKNKHPRYVNVVILEWHDRQGLLFMKYKWNDEEEGCDDWWGDEECQVWLFELIKILADKVYGK